MHPPPIADYALIGDGATAALVSRAGAIDWLCWPRFDSPACLAALLGTPENGQWILAPEAPFTTARRMCGDSMIVETVFTTGEGDVALRDFMPTGGDAPCIVRMLQGRRGRVALSMRLALRFGYGARPPVLTDGDEAVRAEGDGFVLLLRGSVKLLREADDVTAACVLAAGEQAWFVLGVGGVDAEDAHVRTQAYWAGWSARTEVPGIYAQAVRRSALVLKALIDGRSGAMVAAPTTSLPEQPGGGRNWDYRFCWLRDSALAAQALLAAGHRAEVAAWADWLRGRLAEGELRVLYPISGALDVAEREADWLEGYRGARPVRVGNGAAGQIQIDVFGELMDTLHDARAAGIALAPELWALQCRLVAQVERSWLLEDAGIWEVRGGPRHFTHSKVMAWVAVDRGIRDAERHDLPAPLEAWRALRGEIHAAVCAQGYDFDAGCFTQSFGARDLDAALLLIPRVGFLPAGDARVARTIGAIERRLLRGGLVDRYDSADGLPPGEGAFLACSFWLADAMALQGRLEEARGLFGRLLGLCNDVGLLAEEVDPATGDFLGNFPQGFSHLALLRTAVLLG